MLELAPEAAAEQATDDAGRVFLGDVALAERSGRVGAGADAPADAPPGALVVELFAEASGLGADACGPAQLREPIHVQFTHASHRACGGRAHCLSHDPLSVPCTRARPASRTRPALGGAVGRALEAVRTAFRTPSPPRRRWVAAWTCAALFSDNTGRLEAIRALSERQTALAARRDALAERLAGTGKAAGVRTLAPAGTPPGLLCAKRSSVGICFAMR